MKTVLYDKILYMSIALYDKTLYMSSILYDKNLIHEYYITCESCVYDVSK